MVVFLEPVASQSDFDCAEKDRNNWKILLNRQLNAVQGKACQEYIEGIQNLSNLITNIPNLKIVSDCLYDEVGWKLHPILGVLDLKDYFGLLANKLFPVISFLRDDKYLDYLSLPDMWHDVVGHLPLLFYPAYRDLIQYIAKKWLVVNEKQKILLQNVFWFTTEAGVCRENGEVRIYGARLLSNWDEIEYAVSDRETVETFDFEKVFNFSVNIHEIQPTVFEIPYFGYLETIKDRLEELIKS